MYVVNSFNQLIYVTEKCDIFLDGADKILKYCLD
jgi:hypothetical protein